VTIERVLVANRGEIACRVIRSCRDMGIATVAVYSEADADALHVEMADYAIPIGPPPAARSYLDREALLAAARTGNADAVHPGYGFLAESASFAAAVEDAGLVWIGPRPSTIADMGDKERARDIARAAGVPVLPGSPRFGGGDTQGLEEAAAQVGFPLLVKAAAGGGGIGMGLVDAPAALAAQVERTCTLAKRAFDDDTVYLERFVARARHVEVQVFGFGDGQGVHLFDRDCSLQRRYQKIVEEAPAPALPDTVRGALRDAALALVSHERYRGAGTVEFIYDTERGEFCFLEMNTRIQVEHTVTEMITGIDLVRCQIELASGTLDRDRLAHVTPRGAAVECRVYAERPEKNFLPSPGVITRWQLPPTSAALRIDHGLREGDRVTPYYDPLLAKVVTHGGDRAEAIQRMREALLAVLIEGPSTNLAFLSRVLSDERFCSGPPTTDYLPGLL
jgi:acetyl/propionyl-CoA carboxylase alpha subunit